MSVGQAFEQTGLLAARGWADTSGQIVDVLLHDLQRHLTASTNLCLSAGLAGGCWVNRKCGIVNWKHVRAMTGKTLLYITNYIITVINSTIGRKNCQTYIFWKIHRFFSTKILYELFPILKRMSNLLILNTFIYRWQRLKSQTSNIRRCYNWFWHWMDFFIKNTFLNGVELAKISF